jgi:hypothetical protein
MYNKYFNLLTFMLFNIVNTDDRLLRRPHNHSLMKLFDEYSYNDFIYKYVHNIKYRC